jgi:hypothetical protein
MATSPNLNPPTQCTRAAADRLAEILSGPLPVLPPGRIAEVATEVRQLESDAAVAIWRHPGWAELVGWIARQVPDCDPTVPALHAVRHRSAFAGTGTDTSRLAQVVLRVARRSPLDPWPRRFGRLSCELPEPTDTRPPVRTDSLVPQAAVLLNRAGVRPGPETWACISESIDIAVDWWAGLASQTGMTGPDLLAAARATHRVNGKLRLRRHFDGPVARPLVALLVGGDQWGRRARETSGSEAGLLYWAALTRMAHQTGRADPIPPEPVVRAWATTVALVERAVMPIEGVSLGAFPTVAA